jgi:hypothetical protein
LFGRVSVSKKIMSHLWIEKRNDAEERGWQPAALAGGGCAVAADGSGIHFHPPAGEQTGGAGVITILQTRPSGGRSEWALLFRNETAVRVNGRLLAINIRTLRDKDEIRVNGQRMFFSTEELARVVSFPGLSQPAFCPRCKQKIEPGELAVCCPQCQAWSHQSEKLPCWTYDTRCALCQQQPTEMNAGFTFNPEEF